MFLFAPCTRSQSHSNGSNAWQSRDWDNEINFSKGRIRNVYGSPRNSTQWHRCGKNVIRIPHSIQLCSCLGGVWRSITLCSSFYHGIMIEAETNYWFSSFYTVEFPSKFAPYFIQKMIATFAYSRSRLDMRERGQALWKDEWRQGSNIWVID